MPYLFTLFCSCLKIPRTKTPYSATEGEKITSTSRKQTKGFSKKINDLESSELSTINPPHLYIKNLKSTSTTPPIKQRQKVDFLGTKDTEDNLRYRPFSRICPSATFNRNMHC